MREASHAVASPVKPSATATSKAEAPLEASSCHSVLSASPPKMTRTSAGVMEPVWLSGSFSTTRVWKESREYGDRRVSDMKSILKKCSRQRA
jgi:hypothetical protein